MMANSISTRKATAANGLGTALRSSLDGAMSVAYRRAHKRWQKKGSENISFESTHLVSRFKQKCSLTPFPVLRQDMDVLSKNPVTSGVAEEGWTFRPFLLVTFLLATKE